MAPTFTISSKKVSNLKSKGKPTIVGGSVSLKSALKLPTASISLLKKRVSQKSLKSAAQNSVSEDNDEKSPDSESSDGEDDHLHGFSTDEDSSDEGSDMDDDAAVEFDIGKLPTIAKDDETVKRKLDKANRQPVRSNLSPFHPFSLLLSHGSPQTEDRGVLFIGRLPHGFFEDQLRGYFSQFGNVTRVRVSRNKRVSFPLKHHPATQFSRLQSDRKI